MITIGIDMSKNSPGICLRDGSDISFLSFIRGEENKRNSAYYTHLRECKVSIYPNSRGTQLKDYSSLEVWKIADASMLAEEIVSKLPEKNLVGMVGIEGFSYGSKGNSGLDIAGYAYCLRKALWEKYGSSKLCVFSPGNVKKVAGKGNAGKDEIMKFFLETQDSDLREHPFWKGLYNGEIEKKKPVDDLVDAFFVQECTRLHYISKINNQITQTV